MQSDNVITSSSKPSHYSLNKLFEIKDKAGTVLKSVDLLHRAAHQSFQNHLQGKLGAYCHEQLKQKTGKEKLTVFISYAWAIEGREDYAKNQACETYVERLAKDLETAGLTVLLDKWHDRRGKNLTDYIELMLEESTDFLIVVGTKLYLEKYRKKAQLRKDKEHVVRLEGKLLNYVAAYSDEERGRIIPILLEGIAEESLPPLMRMNLPTILENEDYFNQMLTLIRDLYGIDPRDPQFIKYRTKVFNDLHVLEELTTEELKKAYKEDEELKHTQKREKSKVRVKKILDSFQSIFNKPKKSFKINDNNQSATVYLSYCLIGKVDQEIIYFQPIENSGIDYQGRPGSCGYIALGTDRATVKQALENNLDKDDICSLISNQILNDYHVDKANLKLDQVNLQQLDILSNQYNLIAEQRNQYIAQINQLFKLNNPNEEDIIQALPSHQEIINTQAVTQKLQTIRSELKQADDNLKAFAKDKKTVKGYLEKNIAEEWLGSYIALAWAKATDLTLRFWTHQDQATNSRELYLLKDLSNRSTSNNLSAIDLLHTNQSSHYVRLVSVSMPLQQVPALLSKPAVANPKKLADVKDTMPENQVWNGRTPLEELNGHLEKELTEVNESNASQYNQELLTLGQQFEALEEEQEKEVEESPIMERLQIVRRPKTYVKKWIKTGRKCLDHAVFCYATTYEIAQKFPNQQSSLTLIQSQIDALLKAISASFFSNQTALHYFVEKGNRSVVAYLMKHVEKSKLRDKFWNRSLLYIAAENGHTAIVELLLQEDPGLLKIGIHGEDSPGSALHIACVKGYQAIVERLAATPGFADILHKPNRYNNTALHLAAQYGHLTIVKYLVERGAYLIEKYGDYDSPLLTAMKSSDIIEFRQQDQLAAFLLSIHQRPLTELEGKLMLYWSLENALEQTFYQLIQRSVDIRLTQFEVSHLTQAASCLFGHQAEDDLEKQAVYMRLIKWLVKAGLDPTEKLPKFNGNNLLHRAVYASHDELVRFLLVDCRMRPDLLNESQELALHFAACSHSDNVEIVALLLKSYAQLTNYQDLINSKNSSGQTPLYLAAESGNAKIVSLLLQQGAMASIPEADYQGNTPLHVAAEANRLNDKSAPAYEAIIEELIKHGADVTAKNAAGQTALDMAIKKGHDSLIEILIAYRDTQALITLGKTDQLVIDTLVKNLQEENLTEQKELDELRKFKEEDQLKFDAQANALLKNSKVQQNNLEKPPDILTSPPMQDDLPPLQSDDSSIKKAIPEDKLSASKNNLPNKFSLSSIFYSVKDFSQKPVLPYLFPQSVFVANKPSIETLKLQPSDFLIEETEKDEEEAADNQLAESQYCKK